MSSLEEFVSTTIVEGQEEMDQIEELQKILDELDEEPKPIYTSYDIVANV